MLKIGMIGLNKGNGHPYSYSAIFNGYNQVELDKRCPFELIKDYLPKFHNNKIFIEDAKVTHIWTQDEIISRDIAAVSLIPNIVSNYEDLIGKVDAVILARDDIENHLTMALPFIKHGMPIFIDKQIVANKSELSYIEKLIGESYPIMACSSARYTRDLELAKNRTLSSVLSVHGVSTVNWLRYGHHLLEGIVSLWGHDIGWIRSIGADPGHQILQFKYRSGPIIHLEFIEGIMLPIQFTCFSRVEEQFTVPFTDYFFSFRRMLLHFSEMVKTGKKDIPNREILSIAKIIIAGQIALNNVGDKISPVSLNKVEC